MILGMGSDGGGWLEGDWGGFPGLTVIVGDFGTTRDKELRVICRFCLAEGLFEELEISGSVGGFFSLGVEIVEEEFPSVFWSEANLAEFCFFYLAI